MAAASGTAAGGKRKTVAAATTGSAVSAAADQPPGPKRQQITASADATVAAAGASAGALDAGPFGADPTAADFDADQSRAVQVLTDLSAQPNNDFSDPAIQLRPAVAAALVARAIAVDRYVTARCQVPTANVNPHRHPGHEPEQHSPPLAVAVAMGHGKRWVRVRASESDLIPAGGFTATHDDCDDDDDDADTYGYPSGPGGGGGGGGARSTSSARDAFRATLKRIRPPKPYGAVRRRRRTRRRVADDDDDDAGEEETGSSSDDEDGQYRYRVAGNNTDEPQRRMNLAVALFHAYCDDFRAGIDDAADEAPRRAAAAAAAAAHGGGDDAADDGPGPYAVGVAGWVVRALLCLQFVRADADDDSHSTSHSSSSISNSNDSAPIWRRVVMRLDAPQQPGATGDEEYPDSGDARRQVCPPFVYACTQCAPVALALLALPPDGRAAYGLDIDAVDAFYRTTPLQLVSSLSWRRRSVSRLCAQLIRASSAPTLLLPVVDHRFDVRFFVETFDKTLVAKRVRVPLLHWLIVQACNPVTQSSITAMAMRMTTMATTTAYDDDHDPVRERRAYVAAIAALCDRACDDGSGYPVCTLRYAYCGRPPAVDRQMPGAAAAQPPLLAIDMIAAVVRSAQQYARGQQPPQRTGDDDDALQRYVQDGGDGLCARVSQLVSAAVARITAYATNLPVSLRTVLSDGGVGGGRGAALKSSPFPLPLVTLIVGYVLHPRE